MRLVAWLKSRFGIKMRNLIGHAMANDSPLFEDREGWRNDHTDWQREDGNQVSLALECASPAEVDEVYARVIEAGFEGEKEPWDAFWGQRYALLIDPDGVRINLYAAL